jgi:hypothetical protein
MTSARTGAPAVEGAADETQAGLVLPYIDIDEWRDVPVRHRYVHGGFHGGQTRFSFYFPVPARYEGRFFQHVTPFPDSENLAPLLEGVESKIAFAEASGAYFVETNGGGGGSGGPGSSIHPAIAAFRANAAAAGYSREVAVGMYGPHRVYGYLYGGSGGGYRTIGAAENTRGVWDGFVPHVIGSPMAIPNVFTVRMHAQRILRDRLDDIVDAVEPGGSGDPLATLDDEERAAYLEVTRMGFPPRSWFGHRTMGTQAFGVLYPSIRAADPAYFTDFWAREGYLGADATSSVHRDRVRAQAVVTDVMRRGATQRTGPRGGVDESFKGPVLDPDAVVSVRFRSAEPIVTQNADLVVCSGAAAGARISLSSVDVDTAVVDFPDLDRALDALDAGDAIVIDNTDVLAAQTYHRHQVPSADFPAWDQFRGEDGDPVYPQRPLLLGPMFAAGAAGTVQSGAFGGKMIVVESMLDREAFPWQADWYRRAAVERHREDLDASFRLWFVDNALHGDVDRQEHPTHTVSYLGAIQEALRQVSAWVERGIEPAASTHYAVEDAQVTLPVAATERRGIQATIDVTADMDARADVATGEDVLVRVVAEAPPHAGAIVAVAWDLDGDGSFDVTEEVEPAQRIVRSRNVSFASPGERFVAVRITTQGEGDPVSPWARIENVARARVVVSPQAE